ncbi:glycosyltransferase family A protein [Sphingomonas sp. BGYR3]|uniref:glycosyltransferase n=1 Tax=Sphingomonas sp. BGYR3 TaxID=2975483 RepID=UPI0021A29E36|nr:glycosyltransferase family A protein [Sphingomonas sp. BGYR3]MDG5487820.1 glycosyltransferase family A protein [Sphingomonas sp. BGYR3]
MTRPVCVCIPARNEAQRLPTLIEALADQTVQVPFFVSIALNNCDDGSAALLERLARRNADRLTIRAIDVRIDDPKPNAGAARALAMDAGAMLLNDHPDAILISTDADSRPPPGWVAANCAAIHGGLDLVGGRLVIDDREPMLPLLIERRRHWDAYWADVRAIEDAIDPVAWDVPPRHGDHSGASLAMTIDWYRRCGGVPQIRTGEDRALVARALSLGARLGHPPTVWTRVSPRSVGRAEAGMAAAMQMLGTEAGLAAPALDHWRDRARWRRALRDNGRASAIPALEAALPPMPHDLLLAPVAA